MAWTFHKMHGAGNDFMLLDLRPDGGAGGAPTPDADSARRWADRHTGIGFDQLLVLHPSERPEVAARIEIFNADGSHAEQCGNGMRAIGLYLARQSGEAGGAWLLQGPVADIPVRHEGGDQVSVGMGRAEYDPEKVPLEEMGARAEPGQWFSLDLDGAAVRFGALSMGNPHAVIEVDDVATAPVESVGRALRDSGAFPSSCNVGFAQVLDPGAIRLRVLERGSGETLACGSGASAAVAWLARQGRVAGKVRVEQGGGTLWVETDGGVGPVTLTGPAVHVFEGTIE